ncbi:tripartite tricarboxylate transporter TctB family protein [Bradyrhizobium cenepequi]
MINQNVGRGLLVIAIALLFLAQSESYAVGSFGRPGPGLFPILVASMLLLIGLAVLVRSRFIDSVPFEFHFRNIILIIVSLVSFGLVSQYVNMLAGLVALVVTSSLAGEDFSVPRAGTIIAILGLVAVAMKEGLGVQLPLY